MTGKGVVVVTGCGGMGTAVVRRIGSGATIVLADVHEPSLAATSEQLRNDGYEIVEQRLDVSDVQSVSALADAASSRGPIESVIHTAGLSPVQSGLDAILRVDLVGTALMLDAFGSIVSSGGAGVFIASMAGTMTVLDPELEHRLATTDTGDLLELAEVTAIKDPETAYCISKRANQMRIRAAASVWGRRGARVNSISPGIISTPMGRAELSGHTGDFMRSMVAESAAARLGTPDDIAAAVEFLVGPQSGFITGTDLLVDGGVFASTFAPRKL